MPEKRPSDVENLEGGRNAGGGGRRTTPRRRSSRSAPADAVEPRAPAPTLDTPANLSAGAAPVDMEGESLSEEELELYRQRIADGFYDTREVADEVARRMIDRGDV